MSARDRCSVCLAEFQLKKDGTLRHHGGDPVPGMPYREYRCKGSGKPPAVMYDPLGEGGCARDLIKEAAGRGPNARRVPGPVAQNGCDDCSVEPGETHRYPGCPGATTVKAGQIRRLRGVSDGE